jgi:benzylsuccinate CoA-transferase BbsF subunit
VIRLDTTKRPDVLRVAPPFRDGEPGINNSHFYADYNASKLGIGLDVEHPLGRDVALRLVDWCDVLLESFTPKTMAAWGMSYPELSQRNPSMVMLSTCMQGQTGPRRDYRGFGNLMAALSGFYEVVGHPDSDPVPVYGAYTDFICQRFATTALLAALDHRRRTGQGQHIDLSQYEAALTFLGPELLDHEVNGVVATRNGNRSEEACPHGVYPTLPVHGHEGWIAIACHTDDHWRALQAAMRHPEWAADERFSTFLGRKQHEDEIDANLADWTQGFEQAELFYELQPDVPAGMVHDQTGLHEDAQVSFRSYFTPLDHTQMGTVPYDGLQAKLSRTPGRLRKAAPCVGEDTYMVLQEILGMDGDEIADLIAAEAVEIT